MDLIRASIKALFYDYSLQFVSDKILDKTNEALFQRFPTVVQWREQHLTQTELRYLSDIIKEDWIRKGKLISLSDTAKPLALLNVFSNQVLKIDESNAIRVTFDNMLRWRQLSFDLGQDLFITSFLGENLKKDVVISYCWNNCILSDYEELNAFEENGLSDVHTHLWKSVDSAELTWISIMNNISFWSETGEFRLNKYEMDVSYDLSPNKQRTLRDWVTIATGIRLQLYKWIINPDDDSMFESVQIDELLYGTDDVLSSWRNDGLKANISPLRDKSLRLPQFENNLWDYAINKDYDVSEDELKSPYIFHYGERRLLYQCFRQLYHCSKNKEEISKASSYLYLYLLIKIRTRKEYIYTNPLKGLLNFIDYGLADTVFELNEKEYDKVLSRALYRYALCSAIGRKRNNDIESRLTIKDYNDYLDITNSVVNDKLLSYTGQLTYVISISKSITKKKLKESIDSILQAFESNDGRLVGVDFCGYEDSQRPIFFSPYIRYLRGKGIKHFTYHVGEDFVDILDGLRAVDELLQFAEFDSDCRLGHALVLGMDVKQYYRERHNTIILKELDLLDNLVWLYQNNDERGSDVMNNIADEITTLMNKYKYGKNIEVYYKSMFLRCELPLGSDIYNTPCKAIDEYRDVAEIRTLLERSRENKNSNTISFTYPPEIDAIIEKLQMKILQEVKEKGISIEACPSSNLCIGGFKRYDKLPLFQLNDSDISVSINTDDKGVFATSIEQEYALLAIAMKKKPGMDNDKILKILNQFNESSKNQRFVI